MVALGAVHISSEYPQELGVFYQNVLGIDPEWISEQGASFVIGSSRLLILGHDRVRGKNSNPERLFFDILVDDVAAEFKRVVALGAVAVQEPYAFDEGEEGMRLIIATLADLDGNYFQLMSMSAR